jgi:hypothetical protein
MRKLLFFIIVILFFNTSYSQKSGSEVYQFTKLANSARISALGSNFISVSDADISLVYANPALINEELHNQLSFSYLGYFADIKSGFAAYARNIKKLGTIAATMQFIDYGNFLETDYLGNEYGEFTAAEYAFILGWSKKLNDNFVLGANLKNIYSNLHTYKSYGLASDIAVAYNSDDKLFSASVAMKNIGGQISYYTNYGRENIGFNIQAAFSKKFEHAPFRLHFIINDMQKWDLRYELEKEENIFQTEEKEPDKLAIFADNALRHMVAGIELAPGDGNFLIQFAYNYRRRQEMKIASRTAMVGFSFGLGLKISKFKISYGRAVYHLAGSSNHFTISTNLQDFIN